MVTRLIRSGVSPLPSDGLDEAFGFAIGLRTIGLVKRCLMPSCWQVWAKRLER